MHETSAAQSEKSAELLKLDQRITEGRICYLVTRLEMQRILQAPILEVNGRPSSEREGRAVCGYAGTDTVLDVDDVVITVTAEVGSVTNVLSAYPSDEEIAEAKSELEQLGTTLQAFSCGRYFIAAQVIIETGYTVVNVGFAEDYNLEVTSYAVATAIAVIGNAFTVLGVGNPFVLGDGGEFGCINNGEVASPEIKQSTGPAPLWSVASTDEIVSAPAIGDGLAIFGNLGGEVIALDSATGSIVWETGRTDSQFFASPVIAGGAVYASDLFGGLLTFEVESGSYRWIKEIKASGAVSLNGVVYVVGRESGTVFALDGATGNEIWTFESGGAVFTDPVVDANSLYVATNDGTVIAIEPNSGTEIWRGQTGIAMSASPSIADGMLFVSGQDGNLLAIDSATGEERWRFNTGSTVTGSALGAGGVVYISSIGALFAVSAADGLERWRFTAGSAALTTPAMTPETIFVGGNDRLLYAIDVDTGIERWRVQFDAEVSAPRVDGEVVYVGSRDAVFYAFPVAD